jgi:tripartite-type tricarboxylate transporter receptor subunit TctC
MSLAIVIPSIVASVVEQAHAQTPLRVIVPYAAGSGIDGVARLLAPKLSTELGRPVIVENRTGAGGLLASREVANSNTPQEVVLFTTSNTVSIILDNPQHPCHTESFFSSDRTRSSNS